MRLLIPFFLIAGLAPAQIVSVGVKAGVPVTAAAPNYGSDLLGMIDTGRWTIGPTIELRLGSRFSIEADALYRGYRQQNTFSSSEFTIANGPTYPAFSSTYHTNNRIWDFPLLVKYRYGSARYRPFLALGATISRTSSDINSATVCLSSYDVCSAAALPVFYNSAGAATFDRTTIGPTGGIGVELKAGRFKLSPEARYSYLGLPSRHLVTIMLGFTF